MSSTNMSCAPRARCAAAALTARGIGTNIHYPVPVHLQPAYRGRIAIGPGGLGESERAAREILSLPIFPQLGEDQVARVVAALKTIRKRSIRLMIDRLRAAPLGRLAARHLRTTDCGLRFAVRYSRPRYSPTMPRIISCTPRSSTAATSEAQPGGGAKNALDDRPAAPQRPRR